MTNLQLLLSIGIPSLLVILSWVSNKSDITSLRTEMSTLRSDMNREIGTLRSEMTSLRDSIHRDMVALHERVAVVEARQS